MQLAAILVQAKTLDSAVKAVRAAYAAIGAVEISVNAGGTTAHRVVVGRPTKGWCVVTDSTHHTVDLGVAAALGKRALVVGFRGDYSRGKAATKPFGVWRSKPPSSGKHAAIKKAIDKLAHPLLPGPWEMDDRPGTKLAFDVSAATLAAGPFKSNTASELGEAAKAAQLEATWWMSSRALNGLYDEAALALGGLRDLWGYQSALDQMMHSLHAHSMKLERGSAKLYLRLADKALDGLTTANVLERWLVSAGHGNWRPIRHGLALQCALVAGDEAAWTRYLGCVMPEDRERVGLQVWRRTPKAIAKLQPKPRAWLERDLAPRDILAWAQTVPNDKNDHFLDTAAGLAALHGDGGVLDHAFREAANDEYLAGGLCYVAYSLVREGEFAAALALFDRLILTPTDDLTVFTNALYAVQHDNNKLPLDRDRSRRYVDAALPHADANPPIWINVACVEQELGNTPAVLAALAAAKRHKLKAELAELRGAALFKSLRRDPEFVKLVGSAR